MRKTEIKITGYSHAKINASRVKNPTTQGKIGQTLDDKRVNK
jgi:hypothetical protein